MTKAQAANDQECLISITYGDPVEMNVVLPSVLSSCCQFELELRCQPYTEVKGLVRHPIVGVGCEIERGHSCAWHCLSCGDIIIEPLGTAELIDQYYQAVSIDV